MEGFSFSAGKVKEAVLIAISYFLKAFLIFSTYSVAKAPSFSEVTSEIVLGSSFIFLITIPLDFLTVLFSNFSTVISFKCSLS